MWQPRAAPWYAHDVSYAWVLWVVAGIALVTLLPRFLLWVALLSIRPRDLFHALEPAEQPEAWWAALVEPTLVELESLGFARGGWIEIVGPEGAPRVPAALAHDAAGEVFVLAMPATADRVDRETVSLAALTLDAAGRWIETNRGAVVIADPPYDVAYTTEATTAGLLAAHRARLTGARVALRVPSLLAALAQAREASLAGMRARGAWVDVGGGDLRLSLAEAWRQVSAALAKSAAGRLGPAPVPRVPAELDLLLRQQAKARPSLPRRRALALSLASGVALLASLSLLWEPRAALITTLVVVVHELGHALAMRWLGWRDAAVFFVPFLGGVAVGQPRRGAPWRELVVLLAGPVPGLVAGLIALLYSDAPWIQEAAVIAIGLNAFNLLPLHPLDGGRIVHHFLWGRLPRLDVAMRFAAAALLLTGALWSRDWVLGAFSVLFLVGLPGRWARARSLDAVDRARLEDPSAPLDALALRVLAASPGPPPPHARRLAFVGDVEAQHDARAVSRSTSALALAAYAGLVAAIVLGAGAAVLNRRQAPLNTPPLALFRPPVGQPWAWPESMASALELDPPVMLSLRCEVVGPGEDVAQLVDHFALPWGARATAPWLRPLTADEQRARQQWRQLDAWSAEVVEAMPRPDVRGIVGLEPGDAEAARRAMEKIQAEMKRIQALVRAELEARIAREGGHLDPALVEGWWAERGAREDLGDEERSRRREALGRLIGAESATHAATLFGMARVESGTLVVDALGATDVESGVRGLVGWLQQRGCADVRLETAERAD